MPVAKPTSVPTWATTAGNTVVPSGGRQASGWTAGDKPAAKHFNWLFNLIYLWILYLQDLANQVWNWTAAHTFSGGVTFASNLTVNAGKTINMGGNAVNSVGTPSLVGDAANKAYVDARAYRVTFYYSAGGGFNATGVALYLFPDAHDLNSASSSVPTLANKLFGRAMFGNTNGLAGGIKSCTLVDIRADILGSLTGDSLNIRFAQDATTLYTLNLAAGQSSAEAQPALSMFGHLADTSYYTVFTQYQAGTPTATPTFVRVALVFEITLIGN